MYGICCLFLRCILLYFCFLGVWGHKVKPGDLWGINVSDLWFLLGRVHVAFAFQIFTSWFSFYVS